MQRSTRQLAVALAAITCGAGAAHAEINVGPGDSIQAAINAATGGEVVLVAPGTYTERINFFGNTVTLRSSGGAADTIIDGQELGTVVRFSFGEGQHTVIEGFTITGGGSVLKGGGMYISGSRPTVVDCVFDDNNAGGDFCGDVGRGGGVYIQAGSAPSFVGCRFVDNIASGPSCGGTGEAFGGGVCSQNSDPQFLNCIFDSNRVSGSMSAAGGGVYLLDGEIGFTNCLFVGNEAVGDAAAGGAIRSSSVRLNMVNCTFHDNYASDPWEWGAGQVLFAAGASTTFIGNSIIWNGDEPFGGGPLPTVTYSTIESPGYAGVGNASLPPSFVDPAAGNFRLSAGSLCIDAANAALATSFVDLDGAPRAVTIPSVFDWGVPVEGRYVDMGAYEVQLDTCAADINGDGVVNVNDLVQVITDWGVCP